MPGCELQVRFRNSICVRSSLLSIKISFPITRIGRSNASIRSYPSPMPLHIILIPFFIPPKMHYTLMVYYTIYTGHDSLIHYMPIISPRGTELLSTSRIFALSSSTSIPLSSLNFSSLSNYFQFNITTFTHSNVK